MAREMRIRVYAVMHNETTILPYWLRHYAPLADQLVIFDDHSTDLGMELARGYGAEVRPYPGAGLDDQEFVDFAAATYPEARGAADWCLWVDADEFIYHPDLRGQLARLAAAGVRLPRVTGYSMFANAFPTTAGQIYDEVHTGVRAPFYDKPVVFDPRLSLRWIPGKHALAEPVETPRGGEAALKLLHFRHLGERHFSGRNARNYGRMTARNVAQSYGYQTYPQNEAAHGWAAQVKAMEVELQVVV